MEGALHRAVLLYTGHVPRSTADRAHVVDWLSPAHCGSDLTADRVDNLVNPEHVLAFIEKPRSERDKWGIT